MIVLIDVLAPCLEHAVVDGAAVVAQRLTTEVRLGAYHTVDCGGCCAQSITGSKSRGLEPVGERVVVPALGVEVPLRCAAGVDCVGECDCLVAVSHTRACVYGDLAAGVYALYSGIREAPSIHQHTDHEVRCASVYTADHSTTSDIASCFAVEVGERETRAVLRVIEGARSVLQVHPALLCEPVRAPRGHVGGVVVEGGDG